MFLQWDLLDQQAWQALLDQWEWRDLMDLQEILPQPPQVEVPIDRSSSSNFMTATGIPELYIVLTGL